MKVYIKNTKLKVLTPCVGATVGDPNDGLFEPTMAWLGWLMKVYQKDDKESDIIA